MKEKVTTRFTSGFWVTNGLGIGIVLVIMMGLLYGYFTDGSGGFLFIFVIMGGVSWMVVSRFLLSELKHYTVSKEGIDIYYVFRKRHSFVAWNEVTRISPNHQYSDQGTGESGGYQTLSIEINEDRIVFLDEYDYANYAEVAYCMFYYYKAYIATISE